MTDQELVKIAEDIHAGRIFTDRHIRPNDREMLFQNIFMPFALMDEKQRKSFLESKPDLIYEYYDKAGPRSINGYPIFFSFRMLGKEEADKVWKAVKEIEEAMKIVRQGVASDLKKG